MSRYNSKIRGWQRLFLIQRDGNKCGYCGIEGLRTEEDGRYSLGLIERVRACADRILDGKKLLDIHHIRNDPKDHELKLACHSCNMKLIHDGDPRAFDSGLKVVCARENIGIEGEFNRTHEESISYESTDSIRKAKIMRPLFKAYCIIRLVEGDPEVEDIVNSFPAFIEKEYRLYGWGSDRTGKRYLRYMCSKEGEFIIENTPSGIEILKFKDDKNYEFFKGYKLPKFKDVL